MKKMSLYLTLIMLLGAFSFCNRKQKDSVEVAKESNEQKEVLNEDQSDFVVQAASGGLLEVELGKLAQEMAQHSRVKKVAKMMVDDHAKMNQELKELATKKQLTLPGSLGEEQQRKVDELRKQNRQSFDSRYLEVMEEEHQSDIKKFEDASENHKDADIQSFAAKHLPLLRAHLDSVKMIRAALKK
jgi:putative membrane protein